MAVYFPEADALLLLPPKTGSKWVGRALHDAGVAHEIVGPAEWRDHGTLAIHGRDFRFIGSFVRDPIDWYSSYWAYRRDRGWSDSAEIDRECKSDDFTQFVRNMIRLRPGILSAMFESYVGSRARPIDFVGRQERLGGDLRRALDLANVRIPGSWDAGARVNASSNKPELSGELRELIAFSELETMQRFGYLEGIPDHIGLRELLETYPDHVTPIRRLMLWTEITHWEPDDRKALAGRPRRAGTRHTRLLGNFALYAWSILDDIPRAEGYFERALVHDPDHPRTLGNFAVFQQTVRHDPEAAERLFAHALHVRPNHAYNLGNYAYFLQTRSRLDEARRLYERSIELDGGLTRNLANYASCLSQDGLAEEAQSRFQQLVTSHGNSRQIWTQYAEHLERLGNGDAAKRAYTAALAAEGL